MTSTQVRMVALAVAACASLTVSCSDHPAATQTPTQPTRVAEAITVTGARELAEGETVTLAASVRFSNGVTETVTDGIVWASDDTRVASVDQRGVVTALAAGEGRIRATLSAVSGTTGVTVRARRRTISGIVHESFPTEATAIRGARVTATAASGSVQSGVTDAEGRFTLVDVPTDARLAADAPGYESAAITQDPASATLSVALAPTPQEVRVGFEYLSPRPQEPLDQRRFRAAVHRAGELRAEFTNSVLLASAEAFICLEVRDARNNVLAHGRGSYDVFPPPIRLAVTPGYYDVSFYVCGTSGPNPGITMAGFSGSIKHPR